MTYRRFELTFPPYWVVYILPKVIYYNFEQPASGGGGTLTQAAIDRAFKNNCRVTNNTALVRERKVFGLNGQNTGELGVVEFSSLEGRDLRVTNVERTLIDITVRPIYSGGVSEVANAFVAAKGKMSLNRLLRPGSLPSVIARCWEQGSQ